MTKLYVGNLSFRTTETELSELFSQAGAVETVRIITDRDTGRSKGFGFIEMQSGGDKAIEQFNGKEFNGRALTVRGAKPSRVGGAIGVGGFWRLSRALAWLDRYDKRRVLPLAYACTARKPLSESS